MHTRPMQKEDVPQCVSLINDIIARGGSTAHEEPFSHDSFQTFYFEDPDVVHVVEHNGRVVGFQAVFRTNDTRFAVGTFTDRRDPVKGTGRALFDATKAACHAMGGTAIEAKITSDNVSGLGYYSALGFQDEAIRLEDITRKNGVTVDRIVKVYSL